MVLIYKSFTSWSTIENSDMVLKKWCQDGYIQLHIESVHCFFFNIGLTDVIDWLIDSIHPPQSEEKAHIKTHNM